MKILIISYSFYPQLNPRAFRWTSIARYWKEKGYDVTVVTNVDDADSDSDGDNDYKIVRVPENHFGRLRRKLSNKQNSQRNVIGNQYSYRSALNPIKKLLKVLYQYTLKNCQWPDYAWSWIGPSKRAILQLIKLNGEFDAVISVSHPFSSHIIAKSVKKHYPDTTWIMDNGDPFCFNSVNSNNIFLYDSLNKKIECQCIKESDGFAVTTEETKEEYIHLFPHLENKVFVIPPLLNPELEKLKEENKPLNESTQEIIKLVFVGTLYSDIRNPTYFLRTLDQVSRKVGKKIEVDFYGNINDFDLSKLDIKNIKVSFFGSVERDVAYQKMLEADGLVNIGNQTSYQLPSKLVEYAFLGKPILNISSIRNDSSARFLKNHNQSKTINFRDKDKSDAISDLEEFLNFKCEEDGNYSIQWLDSYRIVSIIESYESLFIKKLA